MTSEPRRPHPGTRSPPATPRPRRTVALGLTPTMSGFLLTFIWASLPVSLQIGAAGFRDLGLGSGLATTMSWLIAFGALALVPLTLVLARYRPGAVRGLVTGLSLVLTGSLLISSITRPLEFLLFAAAELWLLSAIYGWFVSAESQEPTPARAFQDAVAHTRGAVMGAAGVWLVALLLGSETLDVRVALFAAPTVAALVTILEREASLGARVTAAGAALLGLLPFFVDAQATLLAAPALVTLVILSQRRRAEALRLGDLGDGVGLEVLLLDPAKSIVAAFLVGGLVGGGLLALPIASATGEALPFVDALFTSFSAICVTGLVVVDTPLAFSDFGHVVILSLIQIGGLGIMTFSTAAIVLLGQRLSLRHEAAAATVLNATDRRRIGGILRTVVVVTLSLELVGAGLLTLLFTAGGEELGPALWRATFTAISAFCNAGFSLQSDSLMAYQDHAGVLAVCGTLIFLGATGPLVVANLVTFARGGRLTWHSKLVLVTSVGLTAFAFVFILSVEWTQTLDGLGIGDRISNALFHAVSLRTAGFNAIETAAVHPATYLLTLPLMIIGGNPGSTAGGIKTTTFAVLVLLVRSAFRNEERVTAFGFEIDPAAIRKAAAVSFLGLGGVAALATGLTLTQDMSLELALFEASSAMGTCGLSVGGTAALDEVGKFMVMATIFAGRVGPLTLLVFLSSRAMARGTMRLPKTDVEIG